MSDSTPPVPDSPEDQAPPPASAAAGLLGVVVEGLAIMAADIVRTHLGRLLQPRSADKAPEVEVPQGEDTSDHTKASGSKSDQSSQSHAGIVVAVILAALAAIILWNNRKK